jgi:Uma2 family endonuclease
MMSVAPQPHPSFEDWLAIERTATDQRSEYVAGEVFAMAGGTEEHNLIVLNVSAELRAQLKARPCRVYPSDMKVRIASDDVGTYPDVMVICGERQFYDDRRDVVTNPILIVEVLSSPPRPMTAATSSGTIEACRACRPTSCCRSTGCRRSYSFASRTGPGA